MSRYRWLSKKDVPSLLTHWSYVFLALTHRYGWIIKPPKNFQYNNTHDDEWNYFRRYWPFVRGTTGHWWIPLTKASDAVLWCFLWSAPEQTVKQTIETPGLGPSSRSLLRHCNVITNNYDSVLLLLVLIMWWCNSCVSLSIQSVLRVSIWNKCFFIWLVASLYATFVKM